MKPTPDQLKAAFERLKTSRPLWPPDFDACMAVPLIACQIQCEAARPARSFKQQPWPRRKITARTIDFKSRAAGEKDDEE